MAAAYTFGILPELSGPLTAISGILGVFTSVMIYHDTQRDFWYFPISSVRFFGAAFGLGFAALCAVGVLGPFPALSVFALKAALEIWQVSAARSADFSTAKKSALMMLRPLLKFTEMRFGFLLLGGFCLILPDLKFLGLALLLGAELMERVLFFKAVVAPKMPGGVHT